MTRSSSVSGYRVSSGVRSVEIFENKEVGKCCAFNHQNLNHYNNQGILFPIRFIVQSNNFLSLEQIIDRHPLIVAPNLRLTEVIRLMQEWGNSCHLLKNIDHSEVTFTAQINNSCALVVEDSQLQGIFTEKDLVRLIAEGIDLEGITVEKVMSREVIAVTTTGSEDIFAALNILRQNQIRHLPVIDDHNQLLGLVTEKDIRQNLQPINLMKWRRVEEIMNNSVIHAPPTVSVRWVAKLMAKYQVSYVAIVAEGGRDGLLMPLGIITERDIVQFQTLSLDLEQPAHKLMSAPLFLVSPQDSLWSAHQLMERHRIRRLLVAGAQGELKGIITQTNLLHIFDPTEMYGLIETLQRQVCQLEIERAEFLENRTAELEQHVQAELNQRQQIEKTKKHLTVILEATTDFVGIADTNKRTVYLNQAGRKMMGFGKDEDLSQITISEYCAPWAIELVNAGLVHATREGTWSGEIALLSRDGREIPVSQVIIAHQESDSSITSFSTIIRDISDRKKIEADLKYRVEFEQLIARIATRFIKLRSAEIAQEINYALQEIAEFTQVDTSYVFQISGDLNSISMTYEWAKPDLKPKIHQAQNLSTALFPWSITQLQQGEILHVPNLADLPAAAAIDRQNWQRFNLCSLICVPLICQGSFRGWLGFASFKEEKVWSESSINLLRIIGEMFANTIQRQQAEIALQKSEEKFRAIFDQTFQFTGLMQLDGTVIEANQTALDFGGLTLADVAGKPLWLTPWWTISAATQETLQKAIAQAAQGEFVRYEVEIRGAGDCTATIDFSIKPLKDQTGRVMMLMSEGRDITEKKQIEAQFLRAQRLESLGNLASGIAHDLNNIFTPILAVTQLLPRHLPDLDDNLQKLLDICQGNVKRGANLVKQILTFARGAEGDRGLVQVKHLIAEVYQIAQETFPKNIEIETDILRNLWTVNGDATQLHQVLMNLAVNARDAMANGGILKISAENFVIDHYYARTHLDAQEGEYILITVSDTGVGIPSDIKERVFEPFFTTKEIGYGTGLGLATVLGIVKGHGGFLDVYSEVGRGSQFRVFLPASEVTETVPQKIEDLPRGHGELILVVDDEAAIRDSSKTILETYNYKVLTARDGIEAIAIYSEHQDEIDLVLMDIMMPSMDGKVAIRTLQKINPQVKIIAVSGLVTREVSSELDDGGLTFLVKPFSTEALLKAIYQVVSC